MNWLARLGRISMTALGIALLAEFLWGVYSVARGAQPLTAPNLARALALLLLGAVFVWAPQQHRK